MSRIVLNNARDVQGLVLAAPVERIVTIRIHDGPYIVNRDFSGGNNHHKREGERLRLFRLLQDAEEVEGLYLRQGSVSGVHKHTINVSAARGAQGNPLEATLVYQI